MNVSLVFTPQPTSCQTQYETVLLWERVKKLAEEVGADVTLTEEGFFAVSTKNQVVMYTGLGIVKTHLEELAKPEKPEDRW